MAGRNFDKIHIIRGIKMDLEQIRKRWIDYNLDIINRFAEESRINSNSMDKLRVFSIDYLIDFESEIEEDPENLDGGILTLDTVYAGYIDSFLGRWYIQKVENPNIQDLKQYQELLHRLFTFIKEKKLYKEGSGQLSRLIKKLEAKKKYTKRLTDYLEIQQEKDDEEKYLDLMREWEYEDLY